jgi:hypothetical protein
MPRCLNASKLSEKGACAGKYGCMPRSPSSEPADKFCSSICPLGAAGAAVSSALQRRLLAEARDDLDEVQGEASALASSHSPATSTGMTAVKRVPPAALERTRSKPPSAASKWEANAHHASERERKQQGERRRRCCALVPSARRRDTCSPSRPEPPPCGERARKRIAPRGIYMSNDQQNAPHRAACRASRQCTDRRQR